MLVTAGYSVDVSGFSRGVNCATGYTKVEFGESEGAEERSVFSFDG